MKPASCDDPSLPMLVPVVLKIQHMNIFFGIAVLFNLKEILLLPNPYFETNMLHY
jgi:hypothetical protein